ncbi:MAG: ATP-binding protein [Terricaulis sp.]
MDPRLNPYAPGAGTPPPELAGRDGLIENVSIALDRIRAGRAAKSVILVGLRGVGKTVLLNRLRLDAEQAGHVTVWLEAPEDRSLPGILAPALRAALFKLDRIAGVTDGAKRALRALAGFISAMKVKFGDVEVGLEIDGEAGLADTGNLENDLADLLEATGQAARERNIAFVLFIDELQYVPEEQLAALISALHRCAQRQLPITLVGAGLPQLVGQTGRAKSYAERLFDFPQINTLTSDAARAALVVPASKLNVEFTDGALAEILKQTQGYPYFLQEWGKHAWAAADASPIETEDALRATNDALDDLDASFFRVRLDRLTPAEKRYLRAMAEIGPGPHRSGDIAAVLKKGVTTVAPIRSGLIAKGMVYSPAHGDTAFTVPLFDGFLRRTIPVL